MYIKSRIFNHRTLSFLHSRSSRFFRCGPSFRILAGAEQVVSSQTLTALYAMGVRLITVSNQKAQVRRIRYPGSPHVLKAWELPPNVAGYQWMIHQGSDTVGCGRFCLVKAWVNVLQRLMIVRDAAIQIVFLLMAWCTIDSGSDGDAP